MNENERYRAPQYPFGFGFALMSDAKAMQHFEQMTDDQKRELGRKLQKISSEQELKNLILSIATHAPNTIF